MKNIDFNYVQASVMQIISKLLDYRKVVGIFLDTIEKTGALYAFNYAFDDSTGKGIGSN